MPRETPLDESRQEPFHVEDWPEDQTVFCGVCDLPAGDCRCNYDGPSAIGHLRAILAAANCVPGNIEVPRQVWDTLNAAEDYLRKFHPED